MLSYEFIKTIFFIKTFEMKTIITNSEFFKKSLIAAIAIIGIFLVPQQMDASHFRGGTVTWQETNNANEVKFTMTTSWRQTFFYSSAPVVGSTMTRSIGTFYFGDGNSTSAVNSTVTAVNATEDWITVVYEVTHTYATDGNYLAYYSGCCRISTLELGNENASFRLETIVNVGVPYGGNNATVSSVPTIINLPTNENPAIFNFNAVDPDGDSIAYRLSTFSESSIPNVTNSGRMAIDPISGQLTFNTTGLAIGGLYATSVSIDEFVPDSINIPDEFLGYDEELGCSSAWIDISNTGAALVPLLTNYYDRIGITTVNDYPFYEDTTNLFTVSTSGGVVPGSLNSYFPYRSNFPNFYPAISVFGDLLIGANGGQIYWEEIGTKLIVQWEEINGYRDSSTFGGATFQMQIDANSGEITFLYQDVVFENNAYQYYDSDYGNFATIGINEGNNTNKATVTSFRDSTFLRNNTCVKYSPNIGPNRVKSKVTQDLFIRVVGPSIPPQFVGLTPANGTAYDVPPGTTLNLNFEATDADGAGNLGGDVTLQVAGAPATVSFSPGLPTPAANPVSTNLSWTPTLAEVGTYVFTFTAQDDLGIQTTTSISVTVSSAPPFDAITPAMNSKWCVSGGDQITFDLSATDFDPLQTVTLDATIKSPSTVTVPTPAYSTNGLAFNTSLPTEISDAIAAQVVTANNTSSTLTWNVDDADWGIYEVDYTATNTSNKVTTLPHVYVIDRAPSFVTTVPPMGLEAVVGQAFSMTVEATDPDDVYGDVVNFGPGMAPYVTLPSWLTITDNEDGTALVSGTPTLADLGVNDVKLEAHDRTTHFLHLHCSQDFLEFQITVIECDIVLSGTVTDALCPDSNDGSINLNISSSNIVDSYVWNNGDTVEDPSGLDGGIYSVLVTETNGCTAEATFTVGDDDFVNPTAICKDIAIEINDSGNLTLQASDIDDGSSDICGIASRTLDITDFDCADAYEYLQNGTTITVNMTVVDNNGNVNSCSSQVSILFDTETDADCDGVSDACDVCAVGDDSYDSNGDGIADCSQNLAFSDYPDEWKCGNKNKKILVCHNHNNPHTICISKNALNTHLGHSGDAVGPCQDCASSSNRTAGNNFDTHGLDHRQIEMHEEVIVSPNPVADILNISSTADNRLEKITLYDLKGQIIFESSLEESTPRYKLDIEKLSLSSGLYLLQVQTELEEYQERIIINR